MPDWLRHVRDNLPLPPTDGTADRQLIEEVASQLEDVYLQAISEGCSAESAERRALEHVEDWGKLATDLLASRPLPRPPLDRFASEQNPRGHGRAFQWLEDFLQDIRFGARILRRRLVFTAVVVLTLGLGIGSITSIFGVVDAVLLRSLPFKDSEDLVSVWQVFPSWQSESSGARSWDRVQYTIEDYRQLADGATYLTDVALFAGWGAATLTGRGSPAKLSVGLASDNLFEMLGVQPRLGRVFEREKASVVSGQLERSVLLSHELWQGRFGADQMVIGDSIRLDGDVYTVLGVLPAGFRLQSVIMTDVIAGQPDTGLRDVWLPLGQTEDLLDEGNSFEVVARLRTDATIAQAGEEALALLPPNPQDPERRVRVLRRRDAVTHGYSGPLTLLLVSAGVLLLISCTNVATLQIAEAATRTRELATRIALGARRSRVVRQIVTENVVLGLSGTLLGLVLATAGIKLLLAGAPPTPRLEEVEMSLRTALFAASLGVGAGLLCGLAPLLLFIRAPAIAAGTSQSRGTIPSIWGFQGLAVGLQVGLTAVLLVAGGLLVQTLGNLGDVQPGFIPENLAVLRVTVPGDTDRASRYFQEGIDRLSSLPGVVSVSGSYGLPFPGGAPVNGLEINGDGQTVAVTARRRTVWPGYHETLGVPILSGRAFARSDDQDSSRVMMLSESLARKHWTRSPVGDTVRFWGESWRVIGVTGDVRHTQLRSEGEPTFYIPFAQAPRNNLSLVVRTRTDPEDELGAMREVLLATDPDVPVEQESTMSDLLTESAAADRYRTVLVLVFGVIAAILVTVGLIGVTARSVAQRTPEMGLRVALGATGPELVKLAARRSLLCGSGGLAAGLGAARWVSEYLEVFLFGIEPGDVATFVSVAVTLLVVCLVAAYVPARRVLRLDPAQVLNGQSM